MYRMPQPVGDYISPQGYAMPQPVGGYSPYTINNAINNPVSDHEDDIDNESEYEYITDDEGDYVEDENGTLYTIEEAQSRGLMDSTPTGERGIGRKLLIGGAILGGTWMLRKQLKKKKRVKKQKYSQTQAQTQYTSSATKPHTQPQNTSTPSVKPQTQTNSSDHNPYLIQYSSQTQTGYGQCVYGQQQPTQQQQYPPYLYGTPQYPNYAAYSNYHKSASFNPGFNFNRPVY